jgi:hypothetical protein
MLDCTLIEQGGIDVSNQSLGIDCNTCGCKNELIRKLALDHFLMANGKDVCYTYKLSECNGVTNQDCSNFIYQSFIPSTPCEGVTITEL